MRSNNRALALGVGLCLIGGAALAQDRPAGPADGPPTSAGPNATSDQSPDRYDQVGYATWYGSEYAGSRTASGTPFDPAAFTAAHRTLPIGSFVEVTALDTGKTVLVMITDRGPSTPGLLIDLSQAAAKAIGVAGRGPVRVRRVTPSAADQNALKGGQAASERLDAPAALLAGLRAQLTGQPAVVASRPSATVPASRKPPASPPPTDPVTPAKVVRPAAAVGNYYVQIAAFGTKVRAAEVARSLGGTVSPVNALWRVRTGPYADAKKAAQARDAAAARGYGDARVVRED